MKVLALVTALVLLSQRVEAQTATGPLELTVHGPQGALLSIDGQAQGRLPLPVNPTVTAGPHRFGLQIGKRSLDSDLLTLSAGGQPELTLTPSGKTLLTFLRNRDGLLLALEPWTLPGALRDGLTAAVASAAKEEHSLLLDRDKQVELLGERPSLLSCIEDGGCHRGLFGQSQVTYVLSVTIDGLSIGGSCVVHTALLDTRTRDVSARANEPCASLALAALGRQVGKLTAKLLQQTTMRPRGGLTVTSTPAGAKVLVDGRWLGVTPFQQEAFAGQRVVQVKYDGYVPYTETVEIEPNQTPTVSATLQLLAVASGAPSAPRARSAALSRPLWRIVTGSILLGGGILIIGFGASALATDGKCKDGTSSVATCDPYYSTAPVGWGLTGAGGTLAIAGTVMLAVPRLKPEHRQ